jgi:hypothetical protein
MAFTDGYAQLVRYIYNVSFRTPNLYKGFKHYRLLALFLPRTYALYFGPLLGLFIVEPYNGAIIDARI